MRAPRRLCLQLLAVVVLPTSVSGCWSTIAEQSTLVLPFRGDADCPPKEAVPLGSTDGARAAIRAGWSPWTRDRTAPWS